MAGAPVPTPPPEAPPPTSGEATKIALALSIIFILCIFGTAFGARQFIRHRQVEVGLPASYQRGRRHHHHRGSDVTPTRSRSRITRAWREMQIGAGNPRTIVASSTRPAGRGAGHRASRGMAEDKIARFSVVSFHDAERRHADHDHDIEEQRGPRNPEERLIFLGDDNTKTLPLLSKALTMVSKSWSTQANAPSSAAAGSAHQSLPAEGSPSRYNCSRCCSICTEDFADGMHVRRLPCGHVFHPSCIDEWLRDRARTCPLCRLDLEAYLVSADHHPGDTEGLQRPSPAKLRNPAGV